MSLHYIHGLLVSLPMVGVPCWFKAHTYGHGCWYGVVRFNLTAMGLLNFQVEWVFEVCPARRLRACIGKGSLRRVLITPEALESELFYLDLTISVWREVCVLVLFSVPFALANLRPRDAAQAQTVGIGFAGVWVWLQAIYSL